MSKYIPPELIPNILARLPSEDLVRCTSVCKTWYNLITSSSFASSHLKLSSPNQESRLLVKHTNEANQQYYNLYRDDQTCDKIADLDCQQVTCLKEKFSIVGSFSGLLCLTEFRKPDERLAKILLWNPSIRKLFILPAPRVIYPNPSIGFSYIPETNDYKIVRVSGEEQCIEVEIYELSKNSWHSVDVGDFSYDPVEGLIECFLNGNLHWVAEEFDEDFYRFIISLDMKEEKFGTMMVPSCVSNSISCVHKFKESLCVIQSTDFCYNIWVMKEYGVADSWRMQFKVDKKEHGLSWPIYVRDNGQIVFMDIHGYLVSYDSTSNRVTNIGECGEKVVPHVTSYVESLVLIKSSNQIRKKAELR